MWQIHKFSSYSVCMTQCLGHMNMVKIPGVIKHEKFGNLNGIAWNSHCRHTSFIRESYVTESFLLRCILQGISATAGLHKLSQNYASGSNLISITAS